MTKTAWYIRCSTVDQRPELQQKDIGTICPHDHEVFKEQLSAWCENVTRPVFQKVVEQIKKQQISDLYVWDLDRIYRNRKRLQEFFILCKSYNCNIHSYRQKWLEDVNSIPAPFDDIVKELLINITGWMAQDESQKKSERVKMAVRKKAGKTVSYLGNHWGRPAFPRQTINRILELHKQGMSIRQIAGQVKVYDRNNNEKPISKSSVQKLIVDYL